MPSTEMSRWFPGTIKVSPPKFNKRATKRLHLSSVRPLLLVSTEKMNGPQGDTWSIGKLCSLDFRSIKTISILLPKDKVALM